MSMSAYDEIAAQVATIQRAYGRQVERARAARSAALRPVQAECSALPGGHAWRWDQIAGEGRYCTRCGAYDSED